MQVELINGNHAGARYHVIKELSYHYSYVLVDLAGNQWIEPRANCKILKEESAMKVQALTDGFMRKKGEWYTVREELKNCYIIEIGKTLTCVLKTDFDTEEDAKHKRVKKALNVVYGYVDTDSPNIPVFRLDWDKVTKLPESAKDLLYAVLLEVKA